MLKRRLFLAFVLVFNVLGVLAQGDSDRNVEYTQAQSIPKIKDIFTRQEDSLKAQFQRKGLAWPARDIYIRSFKFDAQLEVWVRDRASMPYKFFKTYKVCATPGKLGPKRREGDKQVPEGFYYVNELNPNSNYHLALGINYPNVSDRILSDLAKPGGDIYIHGDCVSVGCIAINDQQIEEVYLLASVARDQGQEFIPVHIFPARFNNNRAMEPLTKVVQENPAYVPFVKTMQSVYYYFEKNRTLPAILINKTGEYVTEDVTMPLPGQQQTVNKIKMGRLKVKKYKDGEVASYVHKQPQYEGGIDAYAEFIKQLTNELTAYLDESMKRAYINVEFIVDVDGSVNNVTVIRGGNDIMNEIAITRFEKMPRWKPAIKDEQEVSYKMHQTLFVELAR
jgi:murein L,D-transpeptidase YafK